MSSSDSKERYTPPQMDCATLVINTNIASPDPAVVSKLKVSDILIVRLTPPRGPVQLMTSSNEIAGSIVTFELANLIQCISDGHQYQAKVISVSGGNCQISIRHI